MRQITGRPWGTGSALLMGYLGWIGGVGALLAAEPETSKRDVQSAVSERPRMLVPGFTIEELPIDLTSLNNIEYASDGRLFAAGYDGRFHLLQDSDGDGLEDRVDTFWNETGPNYALGMIVKDGEPHANMGNEIVRFRDTDSDGIPDRREMVVPIHDDPSLAEATYLNHRRVDTSLALGWGPDGAWYVTMGNAGYNNPYWHDQEKVSHYSTDKRRGCLVRIWPDGRSEQLNSGLRYVMSLQWNRLGDLFATDQEGATWCPNGNPFDELLHLEPSRHYGFPPRHPTHLAHVVDEPSIWDYGPQHQSTCGFRFNAVQEGNNFFGPGFWRDNAIVTGESRGNLWRTALAKTSVGYVSRTELIARLNLLVVDCAISPVGDLVICCHTGKPDWGNGPNGAGRIFKIRYTQRASPQPTLVWPKSTTETVVGYDRPLGPGFLPARHESARMVAGRYVEAGDDYETMRPGYAVVQMQQRQWRRTLAVKSVRVDEGGASLIIESEPRDQAVAYAVTLGKASPEETCVAYRLNGLDAQFTSRSDSWQGWLPHLDLSISQAFTRPSAEFEQLWKYLETPGMLRLQGQMDLSHMLQPMTQPGSSLDYLPEPEVVTVVFHSDSEMVVASSAKPCIKVDDHEWRMTVSKASKTAWFPIDLKVTTPVKAVEVYSFTDRDPRPRPMSTQRLFFVPFAKPDQEEVFERSLPELAGANWEEGEKIFHGKGACATCHTFRGKGFAVGPDLNNLVHRDYASVWRDLMDPNAALNPDAIGYIVLLKSGTVVTGTRFRENKSSIELAQQNGKIAKLARGDIEQMKPMSISLMPSDLDKILSPSELRDLMAYLLIPRETVSGN